MTAHPFYVTELLQLQSDLKYLVEYIFTNDAFLHNMMLFIRKGIDVMIPPPKPLCKKNKGGGHFHPSISVFQDKFKTVI